MRFTISITSALLLSLLLSLTPAYCWDCSVSLDGPTWVKIGRTINLTASGLPAGGQYYWSSSPYLVPNNSVATLTGFKPTYSDYIRVSVRYLTPKGQSCSDVKWVYAHSEDCQVALTVASVAAVGAPTFASAEGQPVGGTCAWLSPTNLLALNPQCSLAQYTASTPGIQTFEAEYTTPSGDTCNDSHDTTFYKVGSISSPFACVNSGTTLEKSSFVVTSEPPGYLDSSSLNLTISPLTPTTGSQSATKTIIASILPDSILDNATTTIEVVNPNIKTSVGSSIDIQMPNYISDVLSKVGLADKAKLSLKNSLDYGLNCCNNFSVKKAHNLEISVELGADVGPFTIIGVPLSPSVKDYVALDVLNLILSGNGTASIKAGHNPCTEITTISGGGSISAKADLGGELTLKRNRVLVIEFRVSGSTEIKENFTTLNNRDLYASTSWEGLTASVKGKIRVFGGPTMEITPYTKTYFSADNLLPVKVALPNFYSL